MTFHDSQDTSLKITQGHLHIQQITVCINFMTFHDSQDTSLKITQGHLHIQQITVCIFYYFYLARGIATVSRPSINPSMTLM